MRHFSVIFENVAAVFGSLVILLYFSFIGILSTSYGLPCSYQVPNQDDIIFGVPLVNDPKPHHKRISRDAPFETSFKHLRIHLYFDPKSIDPLPIDKQIFINSTLLPQAIGFWENALLVRRSKTPIRLSRKCKSNHYYLEPGLLHPSCVDRCKEVTNCGEVEIPDNHLFHCRYCSLPNPLSCVSSGPGDGAGVSNTDFLLYVSSVESLRCQNEDTIAYAAHCQQEAELDRPIAGHVNICPDALSTHAHDQEILLSTIKHEILHALGFSAGLYAFFRDAEGRPRTKRYEV
jgi:leishmanolysin-like peptidase